MYKQCSKPVDIAHIERNYLGDGVSASNYPRGRARVHHFATAGCLAPTIAPLVLNLSPPPCRCQTFRTAGSSLAVSHEAEGPVRMPQQPFPRTPLPLHCPPSEVPIATCRRLPTRPVLENRPAAPGYPAQPLGARMGRCRGAAPRSTLRLCASGTATMVPLATVGSPSPSLEL